MFKTCFNDMFNDAVSQNWFQEDTAKSYKTPTQNFSYIYTAQKPEGDTLLSDNRTRTRTCTTKITLYNLRHKIRFTVSRGTLSKDPKEHNRMTKASRLYIYVRQVWKVFNGIFFSTDARTQMWTILNVLGGFCVGSCPMWMSTIKVVYQYIIE